MLPSSTVPVPPGPEFSRLAIVCLFIVVIPVCVCSLIYILLRTTTCPFWFACAAFQTRGHPHFVSVTAIIHLDKMQPREARVSVSSLFRVMIHCDREVGTAGA